MIQVWRCVHDLCSWRLRIKVFRQHTYCHIFHSSRYPIESSNSHSPQCHSSSRFQVLLEIYSFFSVVSALLRARSSRYPKMDYVSRWKSQETCKVRRDSRLPWHHLTLDRDCCTRQAALHVISFRSSPITIPAPAVSRRRTTITTLCYFPDRPSRDTPNLRICRKQRALVVPHRQRLLQWHQQFPLDRHVFHCIRHSHARHDRPLPPQLQWTRLRPLHHPRRKQRDHNLQSHDLRA